MAAAASFVTASAISSCFSQRLMIHHKMLEVAVMRACHRRLNAPTACGYCSSTGLHRLQKAVHHLAVMLLVHSYCRVHLGTSLRHPAWADLNT